MTALNFEPVLLKRYEGKIDKEVSNLRTEREKKSIELNAFKDAFSLYHGKKSLYIDFVAFIHSEDPKGFLIDRFVKDQKLGNVPIRADKLEEFLDIPSYDHLLEYQVSFKNWTREQLDEYYTQKEKKFAPIKVTVEEKEAIVKKHSIYAKTEFALTRYNEIKGFCSIWNIIRKTGRVNNLVTIKSICDTMKSLGMAESYHEEGKSNFLRINYNYMRGLNRATD